MAKNAAFLGQALPLVAFLLAAWYGVSSVVQSKRDLRVSASLCCGLWRRMNGAAAATQRATQGLEPIEEMDPVERMRRRYGLTDRGGSSSATGDEQPPRKAPPPIPTLEEELNSLRASVDIRDFDYKPVPRPPDDD